MGIKIKKNLNINLYCDIITHVEYIPKKYKILILSAVLHCGKRHYGRGDLMPVLKDLIIVGAGCMGREVLQWVKDINAVKPTWNILGFIDDTGDEALKDKECDYKVIGSIVDWDVKEDQYFALAVSNPQGKINVVKSLKKRGAKFATIIHPLARVGEFIDIGEGLVAYPFSGLGPNIKVGNFVTLLSTTIGHDTEVGDYSTICGNCCISGNVKIGKRVFVSGHVSIIPGRKIGDDSFLCIGSVVMTNIKSGLKVMGNPAKKMNF